MRLIERCLSRTALQHTLQKTVWKKTQARKSELLSFKKNKLHSHFPHAELLHDHCTRTEVAALQGGIYNLKIKPLPESEEQPTPPFLLGCAKTSRQVGWILPQPVFY